MIRFSKKYGGQWELGADNERYEIVNRGDDGKQRFYRVEPGKYGQPTIVAEPDLAFDAPVRLTYVNAKGEPITPSEKIAGIICKDGLRLSLTNAASKGIVVRVNDDGSVQIGDETWHLATLFSKDKNRIINYDAYLVRERRDTVRVLELGDLDLF